MFHFHTCRTYILNIVTLDLRTLLGYPLPPADHFSKFFTIYLYAHTHAHTHSTTHTHCWFKEFHHSFFKLNVYCYGKGNKLRKEFIPSLQFIVHHVEKSRQEFKAGASVQEQKQTPRHHKEPLFTGFLTVACSTCSLLSPLD